MTETAINEDFLIARACAAHVRDDHQLNPCLKYSRSFEYPEGKVWVELRNQQNEVVGIYKYYDKSGQLRRQ